ncbi:hypothetical protein DIPPA_20492 [Diplonema papillatum]|nr:hypothetical protein DIPPA_20492 [Diplonema papillatum]
MEDEVRRLAKELQRREGDHQVAREEVVQAEADVERVDRELEEACEIEKVAEKQVSEGVRSWRASHERLAQSARLLAEAKLGQQGRVVELQVQTDRWGALNKRHTALKQAMTCRQQAGAALSLLTANAEARASDAAEHLSAAKQALAQLQAAYRTAVETARTTNSDLLGKQDLSHHASQHAAHAQQRRLAEQTRGPEWIRVASPAAKAYISAFVRRETKHDGAGQEACGALAMADPALHPITPVAACPRTRRILVEVLFGGNHVASTQATNP